MSDPERLRDSLQAGFERSLLEAAGHVGPPPAARQRALSQALAATGGLGGGALVTKGVAHAGAQGAAHTAIAGGVIKAFVVGVVSGVLVAGGAVGVETLARHAPPASTSASPPLRRAVPAPALPGPVVPASVTPPSRRAAPPPATAAPPAAAVPSASALPPAARLPQEVAALDRVRSSLSGGNPGAALAALDGYAARFPRGALAPEATVLRIEALARSGHHASAAALARSFLSRQKSGPLAKRARRYLGQR